MRNVIASLALIPALALAAPDFVTNFQPAILEEAPAQNNETILEDSLLKRDGTNCASGYAVCNNIARPDICCRTNELCTADKSGNAACCPLGAACTGTIGVTVGLTSSIPVSSTTGSSTAVFATPTTTGATSFVQSSNAVSGGATATVSNQFYPFPIISTTYTAAAACSSAYTRCQSDVASCTAALANGQNGVTVSAPNGGMTLAPIASLGAQSAQSICQSLSSQACSGLKVEACSSFGPGNGNGAAPTGCRRGYVGAGVALGIAGQFLQ
jgi:hypothetical protein